MRKIWTWVACCVAVAGAMATMPQAQARPEYLNKGFTPAYPALKAEIETAKCLVCHGSEKKVRNDYGMAVGKALGEKMVKDEEKIKAALKKAEGEKSSTEGKTFGDLIKSGKLPGKAP